MILFFKYFLIVILCFYIFILLFLLVNFCSRMRFGFSYKEKKLKSISSLIFAPYSKLPKNKYLFKNLREVSFPLARTVLPKIKIDDYDFTDVCIHGCTFHKKTTLSKDVDFFQKIHGKKLSCCTLPVADYSQYNFAGVNIDGVNFRKKSILPKKYDLFSQVDSPEYVSARLPKDFYNNCHLYDFGKASIFLIDGEVSMYQCFILYKKYGPKIYSLNLKIKDL